jgi:hypothetical protein
MEDRRWIWKEAGHTESVTVQQLYYKAKHGKITNQTPFWSERVNQWLPLTHLLHDISPDRDRLAKMRESGIEYVKITGSGDDCDACRKLHQRIYSIDAVPELPPSGCTCNPWCGCLIIALPVERG